MKKILLLLILIVCLSSGFIYGVEEKVIKNYQLKNINGFRKIKSQNYQEAVKPLKKSIQLNSSYPVAHNNLGVAYYNLGQYDKAKEEFNKAIDLKDNYVKAYINLASCYFWQGNYFLAYRYYKKGKSIDDEYVEERVDIAKARKEVKAKLKENPNDKELRKMYKKLNGSSSLSELEK